MVLMGHSEAEAADEAAMVRSQLAYARGRAGKAAAAAEQLKQIVRSRCLVCRSMDVGADFSVAVVGGWCVAIRQKGNASQKRRPEFLCHEDKRFIP